MLAEANNGQICVILENIGEGYTGSYNPDDPDDEPLIRFTFQKRADGAVPHDWEEIPDGSYCTRISANRSAEELNTVAEFLMERFVEQHEEGRSVKKLGKNSRG